WLALLAVALGGRAVAFFVVTNHLGRLVGSRALGHIRPIWYYFPNLVLDLLPWSIALPWAIGSAWRARAAPTRSFPLAWAVSMTAVLTASASKRAHYLLPAYPAFALLVAPWWPEATRGRRAAAVAA